MGAVTPNTNILRKNSTGSDFERRRLNVIEGSNVTLTLADDSANDELDLTIASSGGGGGWTDDGTVVRLTEVTDDVGIGTAAPTANTKLHILGDASGNVALRVGNTGDTGLLGIQPTGGNVYSFAALAGGHYLMTANNGNNGIRIDGGAGGASPGWVYIGDSVSANNPKAYLDLNGAMSFWATAEPAASADTYMTMHFNDTRDALMASMDQTAYFPFFWKKVLSKTAAYTMVLGDFTILADATTAAFTVTLPAASNIGELVHIKKTDSSANAVTISRAGADTIEGATTVSLANQYNSRTLVSNGTATWYVIATT